jgi:hypothetical protein
MLRPRGDSDDLELYRAVCLVLDPALLTAEKHAISVTLDEIVLISFTSRAADVLVWSGSYHWHLRLRW